MTLNKKIAIITDTSADLPEEIVQKYNIFMIPLRVTFSNGDYQDRFEITPGQVYERMAQEIPKTSAPTPGDINAVLDQVAAQGYTEAIYIGISSKLSSALSTVSQQSELYPSLKISCVDSKTLSMGLGCCVIEAAKEISRSCSVESAVKHVNKIRKDMTAFFIVRTLEYLKAGGRIGKAAGTIGTLLSIKPIIAIADDGSFGIASTSRGFKKAVDSLVEDVCKRCEGKVMNIAVVHSGVLQEAEALLARLKTFIQSKDYYLSQIGPALATHAGPGLLGIVAYESV